jgi:hypothetical protein
MLLEEIIAVYCEARRKHVNAEFLNVKADDACRQHCVLNG